MSKSAWQEYASLSRVIAWAATIFVILLMVILPFSSVMHCYEEAYQRSESFYSYCGQTAVTQLLTRVVVALLLSAVAWIAYRAFAIWVNHRRDEVEEIAHLLDEHQPDLRATGPETALARCACGFSAVVGPVRTDGGAEDVVDVAHRCWGAFANHLAAVLVAKR